MKSDKLYMIVMLDKDGETIASGIIKNEEINSLIDLIIKEKVWYTSDQMDFEIFGTPIKVRKYRPAADNTIYEDMRMLNLLKYFFTGINAALHLNPKLEVK